MNLSNENAIAKYEVITAQVRKIELPAKVMYAVVKNKNKLKKIVEDFEEVRKSLIEKYAEKDENGEPVVEDNRYKIADQTAFAKEYSELLKEENEVDFHTIGIEALEDCKITGEFMDAISDFVTD